MGRRPASAVVALSLLLGQSLLSPNAGAQSPEIPVRLRWSSAAPSFTEASAPAAGYLRAPFVTPPEEREHWGFARSVGNAALGVGGGALLGGWFGYFVSQVGRSDWDRLPNDEKSQLRRRYAISGAAAGAVVGYFLRPRPGIVGSLPQTPGVPPRVGRQVIATADLRRTVGTNALEVVELDRPEWVKALHDDAARNPRVDSTSAIASRSVVVYVGDEEVGSIESLRDMAVPEIAELRFYDPRDARRRWGGEYRYGAIEVVPASTSAADTGSPTAARP
jgi:MFS family permease